MYGSPKGLHGTFPGKLPDACRHVRRAPHPKDLSGHIIHAIAIKARIEFRFCSQFRLAGGSSCDSAAGTLAVHATESCYATWSAQSSSKNQCPPSTPPRKQKRLYGTPDSNNKSGNKPARYYHICLIAVQCPNNPYTADILRTEACNLVRLFLAIFSS